MKETLWRAKMTWRNPEPYTLTLKPQTRDTRRTPSRERGVRVPRKTNRSRIKPHLSRNDHHNLIVSRMWSYRSRLEEWVFRWLLECCLLKGQLWSPKVD